MSDLIARNRNPHDHVEILGISLGEAKKRLAAETSALPGWGPLSKQAHIISRRHVDGPWPVNHRHRLDYFRKLHDEGRVNICTGRDGSYFILYAMPNTRIVPRAAYFFTDRGY